MELPTNMRDTSNLKELARDMSIASVEEARVVVVPHEPEWSVLYSREAGCVEVALAPRSHAVEHIGSTAVPGLLAKPIIDMLVASVDGLAPSSAELDRLANLGYVYLGEDGRRPGRWFWRKRGRVSFNLSIVAFGSDLWRDNLLVRDYLRGHPLEVEQYAGIKRQAVEASPNSLVGYQEFKRRFMLELKERASEWRARQSSFGASRRD